MTNFFVFFLIKLGKIYHIVLLPNRKIKPNTRLDTADITNSYFKPNQC